MTPFPSIGQFRNVVASVRRKASFVGLDALGDPIYNNALPAPTLRFRGSVKLHGTNAAVVFEGDRVTYQSRERELSLELDNAGFYRHMHEHEVLLAAFRDVIVEHLKLQPSPKNVIAIFGEWCGGNIQKGVALTHLKKMFVVFAIKVNGSWIDIDDFKYFENTIAGLHQISWYRQWDMTIDFNRPDLSQNELSAITHEVEDCCPVGKGFGFNGVGEGVVWRCLDDPSSDYWFKVKGEKHSTSKVKTLAEIDVAAIEDIHEFVSTVLTTSRLEQGLQHLLGEQGKPFVMESIGNFLRWIHGDVMKEDGDILAANNIDPKKVGGPLSLAAKRWYIERLNAEMLQPA